MRKRISKGHSTVEYLLATSLVVVLGGILLWGTDSKDLLKNFLSNTTHGKMNGSSLSVTAMGVPILPPSAAKLPPLKPGEEQLCFYGSDACLTIPVANAQEAETVGGLGEKTVAKAAFVLKQLPQILKEMEVDAPVVDLVTRLSNKGHDMGEQLSAVEQICPAGQLCGGAQADQVKANVNDLKVNDLTELQSYWQTLNDYLTTHPDALKAFPEAKAIIDQKVQEIKDLIAGLGAHDQLREVTVSEVVNRQVAGVNASGDLMKLVMAAQGYNYYNRSGAANFLANYLGLNTGYDRRYGFYGGYYYSGSYYGSYDANNMAQNALNELISGYQNVGRQWYSYNDDSYYIGDVDLSKLSQVNIADYRGQLSNRYYWDDAYRYNDSRQTTQTVQEVVTRTEIVNDGVKLNASEKVDEIHQDSNSICKRGGNVTCFRKKYGEDWLITEPNATTTAQ